MTLIVVFAFLSGIATILAPCIWPLLPIILSATTTAGRWRPLGIATGIVGAFTFTTLLLSVLLRSITFDPEWLRLVGAGAIILFGLTLLVPALGRRLETWLSRLTSFGGRYVGSDQRGFGGGFLVGGALGLLWSPCAGPILATVATVAATQPLNATMILLTLAFAVGVVVPLYVFAWFGQVLFLNLKIVSRHTARIRQVFGAMMIVVAILIYTRSDQTLQNKMVETYPACGVVLNSFENHSWFQEALETLRQTGGH